MINRISESDFQLWLDQEVWVSDCTTETRREWIPCFAEALTEWMEKNGYKMASEWKKGHRVVAYWLYVTHCVSLSTPEDNDRRLLKYYKYYNTHRNWPHDKDYFQSTVTINEIEDFLEVWKTVDMLDTSVPLGQMILLEFQDFLYTWIDPDRSKRGEMVARWFGESSSESDDASPTLRSLGRKKQDTDIYLLEARQGLHGGRGSKV